LGKLTVLSSLGQPLRAEIELTSVTSEEASALVAKLAPAEAFRLANIDFNPTLLSLRFAFEQRGARQFIRVSSSQAVNEPFVDMLLELSWNGGRLVREYTFLLDPADIRQPQSAQVSAPTAPSAAVQAAAQQNTAAADARAERAARAAAQQSAAPSQPAPAPAPAPRASRAEAKSEAKSEYRVKSGDTLTRIASQLKPADISLDMMLVALYRANPDAFNGDNMNRLRSGRILAVPDAGSIRSLPESEARGVVVAHAADFTAYRSKLAGQVAQSTPSKEAQAGQSAAGKIAAKVQERATPANESKDQLKLSKSTPASAAAGKSAVASVEDKIAKDKQIAEAAARVKELEKNVSDLEKLMSVKNKAMQEQAAATASAASAAKAAAAATAANAAATATAANAAAAAQAAAPKAPAAAQPLASAPASASAVASVPAPEAEAPKPKPKPKPLTLVKKPAPPPEPSMIDTITDNLGAIGLALGALVAGAIALVVARRKKNPSPKVEPMGDPGTQAHSMFAETGGQSVDTNNSVFNSNFSPSASQLDTNEVDPVAEADVYIAYGRDAQAEEILREALRMHPERHPVRLKLLEIYAARKDTRSFEIQAGELYGLTKGQGEEWQQAAALGLSIEPLNPLYGNGGVAAPLVATAEPAAPVHLDKEPEIAFDLDHAPISAGAAHALDLDLSQELAPRVDHGMDFASVQETALPTPHAAASDSLDFDLGGLSFEPVVTTAPIAMPAPVVEAAPEPSFDMAFDLPPEAPAPMAPAVPLHDLDFGLDLDASPAHGESFTAAAVPEPLLDLDLMSFDLPAAGVPAAGAPAAATPVAAAPAPLAEPSIDDFFAKPIAPVTQESSASAPEFDLSGIDLDLSAAGAKAALPGSDDPLSAMHMEMDTKLDLAIAYQEIGDKEGARELIDEVIKGGSETQVAKANSMRALLG